MHVTQYQRNEDSGPNAHDADYLLEVCIYDAANDIINPLPGNNSCLQFVALNGVPQLLDSALPTELEVTVGANDDDAVLFHYEDQDWGSNDQPHHSNFGKYDSGKREGDTGFTC